MKNIDISFTLPPYHYLLQVADHCPKATALYIRLWQHKDKYNTLSVNKASVRDKYLTSLAKFRHDLFLLSKEGFISYMEDFNEVAIELVEWSEDI